MLSFEFGAGPIIFVFGCFYRSMGVVFLFFLGWGVLFPIF
jgi:hypothetical protein